MRGRRIYTVDGRRFLDFRFEDGRGFLGAKGHRISTMAKNAIERGLTQPGPSVWQNRLEKDILTRVPGYGFVSFFLNRERSLSALGRIAGTPIMDYSALRDPARRGVDPEPFEFAVWRPFCVEPSPKARILVMPLPCPAPFGLYALLYETAGDSLLEKGDELPPIMPFVSLRALYDLDRMSVGIPGNPKRSSPVLSPSYDEKFWKRADRRLSPFFERRGPYLYARCAQEEYASFKARAMTGCAVLTPEWVNPCIVPFEFDDGEIKKLADALGA